MKPVTQRTTTKSPATSRRTTKKTTPLPPVYEGGDYDTNENDLDDEQNSCASGLRAFASHNEDCHKYYVCNHGNAIEMSCGDTLFWNPKTNSCDWPQNVQCDRDEEAVINEVEPIDTEGSNKPQTTKTTQKPPRKTTASTTTAKPRPTKPPVVTDPFIPTGNNKFMVVW